MSILGERKETVMEKAIPLLSVPISHCCGCAACSEICPTHSITMSVLHGFDYPAIDDQTCVRCQKCLRVCSFKKHMRKQREVTL